MLVRRRHVLARVPGQPGHFQKLQLDPADVVAEGNDEQHADEDEDDAAEAERAGARDDGDEHEETAADEQEESAREVAANFFQRLKLVVEHRPTRCSGCLIAVVAHVKHRVGTQQAATATVTDSVTATASSVVVAAAGPDRCAWMLDAVVSGVVVVAVVAVVAVVDVVADSGDRVLIAAASGIVAVVACMRHQGLSCNHANVGIHVKRVQVVVALTKVTLNCGIKRRVIRL